MPNIANVVEQLSKDPRVRDALVKSESSSSERLVGYMLTQEYEDFGLRQNEVTPTFCNRVYLLLSHGIPKRIENSRVMRIEEEGGISYYEKQSELMPEELDEEELTERVI